jgi:hypothetical protein
VGGPHPGLRNEVCQYARMAQHTWAMKCSALLGGPGPWPELSHSGPVLQVSARRMPFDGGRRQQAYKGIKALQGMHNVRPSIVWRTQTYALACLTYIRTLVLQGGGQSALGTSWGDGFAT